MPNKKWWILNLNGTWSKIDPQPKINSNFWDVAFEYGTYESSVKLSYFAPWKKQRKDKLWRIEFGLFHCIKVYTSFGFTSTYDPMTLELFFHSGMLPEDNNKKYTLGNVPKETLEFCKIAARNKQEEALKKRAAFLYKRRFKGKFKH